jgi:hypothetical protein
MFLILRDQRISLRQKLLYGALAVTALWVAPASAQTVAIYTFADGGLDSWAPFGPVTLTNAAPPVLDPAGKARSLLTTNRTATFMGPSLNLLGVNGIVPGATYQVSAYVLLAAPDSANPTATMSTKTVSCATSGSFANLATSAALSSTAWTQVQGLFSFSDQPGPPSSLTLYLQSSSATDSFYISNVVITEVAPPPNPGSQDNSGISTNFENGGTDGWSSRSGSSTVANSTAAFHTGTHSLLTTGRIGNWDGPQIGVVDETQLPGYGLKLSARLSAGTRTTRTLTISATNGTVGPAYSTQINGLTLTQDSGAPCTPQISAPGAFPVGLGDIAPGATASASFTINTGGCNPSAEFILKVPWSSSTYHTGTLVKTIEFDRPN